MQKAVDRARAEGADYVIALTHLGEKSFYGETSSHNMVAQTRGIDIVLDGHTHSLIAADTVYDADGKPVLVCQTGSSFSHLGKLLITPDGHFIPQLIPAHTLPIAPPKNPVRILADSIQSAFNTRNNRILDIAPYPLKVSDNNDTPIARYSESPLGNMLADAMAAEMHTQIAVLNGGALRNDIEAGEITTADIITLIPFKNHVVKVSLTGQQLATLLAQSYSTLPLPNGLFCQPINPQQRYTIATLDYLIHTQYVSQIFSPDIEEQSTTHITDIFANYLEKVLSDSLLTARYRQTEGRIRIVANR